MNIMKGIGMIVIFTFLTACTVHEINQDTFRSRDVITTQPPNTSGTKMNEASIPTPRDDLVGTSGTEGSNSPHSFTLDFSKVEWEQPLPQVPLTNNLGTVVVKKQINDYVVFLYQKDQENIFAAIQSGSTTFDIGQIGYTRQQKDSISIEEVDAFGKAYVKITGFCGANCPITNYVQMDKNPPSLLQIQANTVEADLNQDGVKEIIATVGTLAETSNYRLRQERMETVNLNEAMKAQVVIYKSETNTFEASIQNEAMSVWKYFDGKMVSRTVMRGDL
ncbi:hypothetical protein [uncultured Brevibacillus sp.]|uniref:hypothetical protein n=1 Tax=uncultured Brevibacillus sp. TaxID=169970 RepID=UPI0025917E8A|nr:hypothetical protein [uncultured Brevibacillus sp.]